MPILIHSEAEAKRVPNCTLHIKSCQQTNRNAL